VALLGGLWAFRVGEAPFKGAWQFFSAKLALRSANLRCVRSTEPKSEMLMHCVQGYEI